MIENCIKILSMKENAKQICKLALIQICEEEKFL